MKKVLRISCAVFVAILGLLNAYSTEKSLPVVDSGLPNLSDRPKAQDKNIDVFANVLYWYTSETLDWAFTLSQQQNFVTSYKTLSFDWAPGFRVGVGYNMHHDDWDTQASYTWFQSKATDHLSGSVTPAFFAARLSLLEPFETGKVRLDLHYNIFDWDLGRSFLVSRSLSMRPFIGIKAGWINQTIHTKWTIPNFLGLGGLFTASENLKNNFRGGGPKGGVYGKWILGNVHDHSFSLIGNFESAYMWGHWTISDQFFDVFNTQISTKVDKRNLGAFMFHGLMGLGWDFNFDKDRSHFALKAGYEIQDWLNQVQLFTDASGGQNNDLIIQGLTVDLRFDF